MSGAMILWLPLIVLRSLMVGGKTLWMDGLLLLAGVACILAQGSTFAIEASWRDLPLYVLSGVVLFVLSVSVTSSHPTQYLRQLLLTIQCQERRAHTRAAWSAVITALSEEIVWRVVFQTVLSMSIGIHASVAVVAASFTFLHRHRTLGFTVQFVELLAFSLVLGVLFALSYDVMLVIAVHAVRNYFIGIQGEEREAQ